MAESKITYVLALDVTKVTEGFKKVQEVEAVLDKNLHVLATDLEKIGNSAWLNKAFGGTASANQKVLELAKAMQTLKETATRDYAARAIHSQEIVALLTKEKTALEALRKAALNQTQKGTFSQGLADASKSIANIQQQIDYHNKLAKSMEKELYALEEITRKKKLLAELDANARKRSAQETGINLIRPSEILGTSKSKSWKASDILTANEVKILETNVQRVKDAVAKLSEKSAVQQPSFKGAINELDGMIFGTAKALSSYKANLKEAETLLANFYKKQEDLRLANASKVIQLPQLSGLKASDSIFASKEAMLAQENSFIAKQEAIDNALYNSMKTAIVNQASLEAEKQTLHKQTIQEEVAYRASLQRLASTAQMAYNAKFVQKLPSSELAKYDPNKSPFKSVVAQQLKDDLAREKAYTNESKGLADKRKKDEQELANFLLKQEEELLAKMRGRWNTFANEQKQFEQAELARVAKLATEELRVKEQALTAYNQAMKANSNAMVASFKQAQAAALTQTQAIQASASIIGKLQTTINNMSTAYQKQQATQQAQAAANQIKQAQTTSATILANLKANLNAQAAATKAAKAVTLAQAKQQNQQLNQASKVAQTLAAKSVPPPNLYTTTPISKIATDPTKVTTGLTAQTAATTAQLTTLASAIANIRNLIAIAPAGVLSPTTIAAANAALGSLNTTMNTLRTNLTALNTVSAAIPSIIATFNSLKASAESAWKSYQDLLVALQNYRRGLSQTQLDTLNNVNAVKAEIGERNRLRKAYNDLSPALKQAAAERQKELNLNKLLSEGYARYQELRDKALLGGGTAGITYVQNLTAAWLAYQQRLETARLAAVAQGNAAVAAFEAQEKALARLQAKASSYIAGKQVGDERTGILGQMQASGASKEAINGQKIRFELEDIGKKYDKLVAKFQEKTLNPNLDQAALAKMRAGFLAGEAALLKQRDAAQQALGAIERLTQGVHKLDRAHQPLLVRIAELSGGYMLVNSAIMSVVQGIKSIPTTGIEFESSYASLKAILSVTSKVNSELKFLDDLAQSAGISISTLRTTFTDFAASAKFSGEKLENINEIFANISKAGMVLHLPADKMKSAFIALNQMYAKNQVMMEELKRQLGNQLPAAVNIFALSMGKTTRQLMDDMKKGLVVPKETLLNFSRTYAAMFADPASMEYASQGVNAHFQRLETAWTNFATKIYDESKGAIKDGLSITTAALDMVTNHMTALKNVTLVTAAVLGGELVVYLGRATLALMATRNATLAAAGAMSALTGTSAVAAGAGAWATISTFFKGIGAAILAMPTWVKFVAGIAVAIISLKDLEVATISVKSSIDQLNGKAVDIQQSLTVSDYAIASWDLLIEKLEKVKNTTFRNSPLANAAREAAKNNPVDVIANGGNNNNLNAIGQRAARDAKAKANVEEIVRQTEYTNEKVKEALLAGTTGTVDETMAGMTKIVSTALQVITTEFDIATQRLQGQSNLKVKDLQFDLSKVKAQEAAGTITKLEALKQTQVIQAKIRKEARDALQDEITLLKEQQHRVKLVGDTQLENSAQSRKAATEEDNLVKLRAARANIAAILPTLKDSPYKDKQQAETALGSGDIAQALKTLAVEEWNKNNPTKPLFAQMDLTNKALLEQTKVLDKARAEYDKLTTEHNALQLRVANGTTTSNDLLEKIVTNTDPANTNKVEVTGDTFTGATALTATDSAKKAIDFFIAKGWKPEHAIGITANIQGESNFNTGGVGDGGVAYGLGQWHPDRQANFAKAFGKSIKGSSFEDQLAFVDWELKNTEARAGSLLKATKTVAEATNTVTAAYERPKETAKDQSIRRSIAKSYLPSAGYVKSGAEPAAQASMEVDKKLESAYLKQQELDKEERQAKFEDEQAKLLEQLQQTKANLTANLQLSKTTKETELAKLDNLAFPLSDKQRLAKTAEINAKANPELVAGIDKLVANAKETILRTADTATKSGLQAEILNLEKERASIAAETLKDKTAIKLNKIIPLQDALERKQFEIQKSLEESLGIFKEETVKMSQRLSQEDTIKLLYTEQARLKQEGNGLSKQEIADKELIIAKTEKQLAQLNQIELMKAKIANEENNIKAQQGLEQAKAENLPIAQAASYGVSGRFVGSMIAQEAARAQSNTYGRLLEQTQERLKIPNQTPAAIDQINTEIQSLTKSMRELETAKNAVFNQALNETVDSLAEHFVAWANGAETVKQAFRGIAIDFAKMIQEMLVNELKIAAVKGIMSMITGMSGGGAIASIGTTNATSAISMAGFATGGSIQGFPTGGDVRGNGTGTSDSIPSVVPIGSYVLNAKASAKAKKNRLIKLSHGETVISPEQVAQLGINNLDTINTMGYATGGVVGGSATSSNSAKATGKNSNVYNINVAVPEGTSNPQKFGQDTGVEIFKAIAREEAKRELNRYDKQKVRGL